MRKLSYIFLFLIAVLLFFLFYKRGTNIEDMNRQELTYRELPQEIQKLLHSVSAGNNSLLNENLIILDKKDNYKLEVVKTGPWVDYSILKKKNGSVEIRIPRGFPHPYIIYKNKVYLSKDYNVINRNNYENIIKSSYYEYVLE